MLSVSETRRLDRLALAGKAVVSAAPAGGRSHPAARGHGLDFHDYRSYQPGDDPRLIDWTVDARLRQLVVRVARAEGHVRLHLLVDGSQSMSLGTPDKLTCAKKLAAVLGYLAVERRDPVGLATFDHTIRHVVPVAAGRPQLFRVYDALRHSPAAGASAIDRALIDYGAAFRGPGLVVVLSDFFHAGDTLEGVKYLLYKGLTPALVQIVADEELSPPVDDEVELTDVENPAAAPLVVDREARLRYIRAMTAASERLREFCRGRRLMWARIRSSASFDELLAASVESGLITGLS